MLIADRVFWNRWQTHLPKVMNVAITFPKPNAELELIVEAIPFLREGETRRNIKVEANGIPAGTLIMKEPSVHFYPLPLPAAANQNFTIRIRFSCAPPTSPSKGGKLLEMGLARLALVPINIPTGSETERNHETALNQH